jgi:hypothetical protein
MDGKETLNTFQLNGAEGIFVSEGGQKGTGKAWFKGKVLTLETLVTSRPQANGPEVQIRTKEQWELSSDSKTLTIDPIWIFRIPDSEDFKSSNRGRRSTRETDSGRGGPPLS